MTSREEIALQLTLKTIEKISFDYDNVKKLQYEIYNSIYENIKVDSDRPVKV
ncbi:MAG: hypothetical protein Q4D02_01970 [Clostridia bacterium]|nr:hypothetical protein [Clostridia bacterium]